MSTGLVIEVQINEAEYLPHAASAAAGVRVHLTTPGTRPNPSDSGYYVPPGFEVDVAFKMQTVSRLPAPYTSDCWDNWNQTDYQPMFYVRDENITRVVEKYLYDVSDSSHDSKSERIC